MYIQSVHALYIKLHSVKPWLSEHQRHMYRHLDLQGSIWCMGYHLTHYETSHNYTVVVWPEKMSTKLMKMH